MAILPKEEGSLLDQAIIASIRKFCQCLASLPQNVGRLHDYCLLSTENMNRSGLESLPRLEGCLLDPDFYLESLRVSRKPAENLGIMHSYIHLGMYYDIKHCCTLQATLPSSWHPQEHNPDRFHT
jgi:hypothetical protein